MKKLFALLAVFVLSGFVFASSAAAAGITSNSDIKTEQKKYELRLSQVQEALNKEIDANERQSVYFYHQNLLFRVEELNEAFVKISQKDELTGSVLAQSLSKERFTSSRWGEISLLSVIEKLEDFNWGGPVEVQAKELKAALNK